MRWLHDNPGIALAELPDLLANQIRFCGSRYRRRDNSGPTVSGSLRPDARTCGKRLHWYSLHLFASQAPKNSVLLVSFVFSEDFRVRLRNDFQCITSVRHRLLFKRCTSVRFVTKKLE